MQTITICGSMKFITEIKQLRIKLEEAGFKVLSPHDHESDSGYSQLNEQERADRKNFFIDEHIDKIKCSDATLVANYTKNDVGNYIGANTFMEMAFAYILGKKIFILNTLPEQENKDEIRGVHPIILNGEIGKVKDYF